MNKMQKNLLDMAGSFAFVNNNFISQVAVLEISAAKCRFDQ